MGLNTQQLVPFRLLTRVPSKTQGFRLFFLQRMYPPPPIGLGVSIPLGHTEYLGSESEDLMNLITLSILPPTSTKQSTERNSQAITYLLDLTLIKYVSTPLSYPRVSIQTMYSSLKDKKGDSFISANDSLNASNSSTKSEVSSLFSCLSLMLFSNSSFFSSINLS
jgi:hypothetical protein